MTYTETLDGGASLDRDMPVPGPDLRFRVTGVNQTDSEFREQGRRTLADWERALRITGRAISSYRRILDFGAGCGRVTRHLIGLAAAAGTSMELDACDIDADAITWASDHLDGASFVVNGHLPPLPYPDGHFDLIVNHSVFTHLPEDYQDAWLAELRRVAAPGAHLVLSVAGPFAFEGLVQSYLDWPEDPSEIQRAMREDGLLYVTDDSWTGSAFPEWYHSTFHSADYVLRHWGSSFDVLAYLPRAALSYQDIVVLQRPVAAAA